MRLLGDGFKKVMLVEVCAEQSEEAMKSMIEE